MDFTQISNARFAADGATFEMSMTCGVAAPRQYVTDALGTGEYLRPITKFEVPQSVTDWYAVG